MLPFCLCVFRHEVFLQTRKYSSDKVREIITRDTTLSLAAATDRKLPFPRLDNYMCVWEPNDSAVGPGKLYLAQEVTGKPSYEDFGPVTGEDGQPVAKSWALKMKMAWASIQEHFSGALFTQEVRDEWETFFRHFPWNGLSDLPDRFLPPFKIPRFFNGSASEPSVPRDVSNILDSVGLDAHGRERVHQRDGRDTLLYPRVGSKVTYNDLHLDMTKHRPKKR